MHIAATNPAGLNPEDVDQAVVEKEKEIHLKYIYHVTGSVKFCKFRNHCDFIITANNAPE